MTQYHRILASASSPASSETSGSKLRKSPANLRNIAYATLILCNLGLLSWLFYPSPTVREATIATESSLSSPSKYASSRRHTEMKFLGGTNMEGFDVKLDSTERKSLYKLVTRGVVKMYAR